MNKKAVGTLIKVIIFAVALVVLSTFVLHSGEVLETFTGKNICKTSVYAEASKQLAVTPFQGIISIFRPSKKTEKGIYEIPCPTEYITIEDKEKETIKRKLANRMHDCLDNFLYGTKPLFEIKTGEEKYCIICHHITFDGGAKSKFISEEEFDDFLNKESINTPNVLKEIYPEKTITYKQIFAGYTTYEDASNVEKEQEIKTSNYNIVTDIPYATVFTYAREGYLNKFSTGTIGTFFGMVAGTIITIATGGGGAIIFLGASALGGIGGGGIGYLLGHNKAVDWEANIFLMPYAALELDKLDCTYLPQQQEE